VVLPPPKPLTPQLQQQQLKVLPNLGYACLCMTLRKYDIFNSRDCVKKTRDMEDGLQRVSELAQQNAR
jgi:UV DNA damage endonuclease